MPFSSKKESAPSVRVTTLALGNFGLAHLEKVDANFAGPPLSGG